MYLLANRLNGTPYVGVTADLVRRVGEHREGGPKALLSDAAGCPRPDHPPVKPWVAGPSPAMTMAVWPPAFMADSRARGDGHEGENGRRA
ncbi:MAG: hypothetical protein ACREFY_18215 [Acetobacteraceae bacterium]